MRYIEKSSVVLEIRTALSGQKINQKINQKNKSGDVQNVEGNSAIFEETMQFNPKISLLCPIIQHYLT